MSLNRLMFLALLAAAPAAQSQSSMAANLPSVEGYASNVLLVELCKQGKPAAHPRLQKQKAQVLAYYRARQSASPAESARYEPLIRQVEQDQVPPKMRKDMASAFTKDAGTTKFICSNMDATIDSSISLSDLAMAETSRDPAAKAAANKRALETMKSNSESIQKSLPHLEKK